MPHQDPPKFHVIADGNNTEGSLDLRGVGSVSWLTHVGHIRSRNEDRYLAKTLWDGAYLLLLVADGAGGHEAGDAAATASVETFDELLPSDGPVPSEGDPRIWLHDTIVEAHVRVVDLATSRIRPPASTLVGMLVELASLCAWRFHVGDSRLYVRGLEGMVSQWTRDHNITNGLIDRGLSVEQAMRIADGGRLTQVVGGTSDIEPEVHGPLALQAGQTVLLCSDGVYGHNENPEILPASMEPGGGAQERVIGLRDDVLGGGAPDNLTAILWQIDPYLEATAQRETVTNSMPSVSAEAIEAYIEQRNLADLASVAEDAERVTDSSLAPEDALTVGAMEALVPRPTEPPASEAEEDTLGTKEMSSLTSRLSADDIEHTSASLAAASASMAQASCDAADDTRSALLLVLALVVVLGTTYTTVVSDMRGETSSPVPPAAALEDIPELPDEPQFDVAPDLPGPPESAVEEELPGSAEPAPEVELPGDPAVERTEDPELPDAAPDLRDDARPTTPPVADAPAPSP